MALAAMRRRLAVRHTAVCERRRWKVHSAVARRQERTTVALRTLRRPSHLVPPRSRRWLPARRFLDVSCTPRGHRARRPLADLPTHSYCCRLQH